MDSNDAVPKWRFVLERLAERIDDGFYFRDGRDGRMEPVRAMTEEFQVGRKTVQTALIVLEDRGVVESRQGKAYYVVRGSADRQTDR